MESQMVVATEVAAAEFARFCEQMDLDVDTKRMDAEDLKTFESAKHKLVREIERGSLTIDDKGQPVYRTSDGVTVTFYEPTGASFMAMDTKKKDQNVAKMFAVLADMTKLDQSVFAKMKNRDSRICQTIVALFLG